MKDTLTLFKWRALWCWPHGVGRLAGGRRGGHLRNDQSCPAGRCP